MSRISTLEGGSAAAVAEPKDTLGRKVGKRGRRGGRGVVMREIRVGRPKGDYAQLPTADLLGHFWEFAKRRMSSAAAALVSLLGAEVIAPFVTGELSTLVMEAGALQKAHGRSISPEEVAADLEITIPAGYTPNFDLYLQSAGIKPETEQGRKIAGQVRAAIRRKLNEVRNAGESPP
jgi:hypothetical protein